MNSVTLRNKRLAGVCATFGKCSVILILTWRCAAAQLKETDTPVTALAADCVTFTIQLTLLPVLYSLECPIKVSPLWCSTCSREDVAAAQR